jgi:hypothetical protein
MNISKQSYDAATKVIADISKKTPLNDKPDKQTETTFKNIIASYIEIGAWDKLDIFYLFLGNSFYWKNINWKSKIPVTASYYNNNINSLEATFGYSYNNQTLRLVNGTFLETDVSTITSASNTLIGVFKGPVDTESPTAANIGQYENGIQLSVNGIENSIGIDTFGPSHLHAGGDRGSLGLGYRATKKSEDYIWTPYYENFPKAFNKSDLQKLGGGAGLYIINQFPETRPILNPSNPSQPITVTGTAIEYWYNNTKYSGDFTLRTDVFNTATTKNRTPFCINAITTPAYMTPGYINRGVVPIITRSLLEINTFNSGSVLNTNLQKGVYLQRIASVKNDAKTKPGFTIKWFDTSSIKASILHYNPINLTTYTKTYTWNGPTTLVKATNNDLFLDSVSNAGYDVYSLSNTAYINNTLPDDIYWYSKYPKSITSGSIFEISLTRAVKDNTPTAAEFRAPLFRPLLDNNDTNVVSKGIANTNNNISKLNKLINYNNYYGRPFVDQVTFNPPIEGVFQPPISNSLFIHVGASRPLKASYPMLLNDSTYTTRTRNYSLPCKFLLPPPPPPNSVVFIDNRLLNIGTVVETTIVPTASISTYKIPKLAKNATTLPQAEYNNIAERQYTGNYIPIMNQFGYILETQTVKVRANTTISNFSSSFSPFVFDFLFDVSRSYKKQFDLSKLNFLTGSSQVEISGVGIVDGTNINLSKCHFSTSDLSKLIDISQYDSTNSFISFKQKKSFKIQTNNLIFDEIDLDNTFLCISGNEFVATIIRSSKDNVTLFGKALGNYTSSLSNKYSGIQTSSLFIVSSNNTVIQSTADLLKNPIIITSNIISGSNIVSNYNSGTLLTTSNATSSIVNHGGIFSLAIASPTGTGKIYLYENETDPSYVQKFPNGKFLATASITGAPISILNITSSRGFHMYISGTLQYPLLGLVYANTASYAFFRANGTFTNILSNNIYYLKDSIPNSNYATQYSQINTGIGGQFIGKDNDTQHYVCVFRGTGITGSTADRLGELYDVYYDEFISLFDSASKGFYSNTNINPQQLLYNSDPNLGIPLIKNINKTTKPYNKFGLDPSTSAIQFSNDDEARVFPNMIDFRKNRPSSTNEVPSPGLWLLNSVPKKEQS